VLGGSRRVHMISYQGDSFVYESLLSNNRFPILVGAG